MKKRLLFAALAMMCAGSSFAYEVDDYVFTSSQKLKITSENLVENGDFSADFEGWTDAEGSPVNGEVWGIEPGVGPNGENAIKSSGAAEGVPFCRSFELEEGTYIATFQIKGTEAGKTSIGTTSNDAVTISGNCADIFINYDGTLAKGVSSAEFPVQNVAAAADFTSEWTTVNFYFEIVDTLETIHPALVMYFERMATDVMITNIAIHNAEEVYDTRTTDRLMAYAELLMEDANFNTGSASGAKTKLQNAINQVKAYMDNGQIDSRGSSMETALISAINNYLDVESTDMSDQFSFDFASIAAVGRGRNFPSGALKNVKLNGGTAGGGNWGHIANEDCLMSAIQTGQKNHTATFEVFNTDFPAGKYFFTAEIRNAYTGKSSWPCPGQTFTLETMCQMSIGETTIDVGPVVGEQYQRFYLVAEVAESGQFNAKVYWPGNPSNGDGGAFYIREVSVRAFGDPQEAIERLAAWKAFKAQYDAAVGARNTIVEMQSDANYPWNKAALQEALETYDPLLHITDGWVSADGEDTRAATTDQLNEWAKYQGGEIPEDEKATYYVVRGYQAAITAVREANKPITDLNAGIANAQDVMNDGLFSAGDRAAFAAAIQTAQNTVDGIKASTSDATSEADAATLVAALETLNAAVEAYKVSANVKPIVDIDFSDEEGIKEIMNNETGESYFVIKGKAGEMQFPAGAVNPDDPDNTWTFALGYAGEYPDVLHVGGGHLGTVALPEVPTDNDGLRINFDLWVGNLGKSYIDVELFNAGGIRVAGFSLNRYDPAVGYNEFNNEENTGLDILKYVSGLGSSSVGNAGICTDANKSSFTLDIDYKAGLIYGNVTNGRNGTCKGARIALPMPADEDNKIVTFAVGCDDQDGTQTYTKSNSGAYARRCWFDNLTIYKYASVAGEQGIETIAADRVAEQGIFNLQGQKVQNPAKGLYIINGKKYIVK